MVGCGAYEWAPRGSHGLHLEPLDGVLESHVVPHGVWVGEPTTALDHRTHGTVPGIVTVQVLPEDTLFQGHLT